MVTPSALALSEPWSRDLSKDCLGALASWEGVSAAEAGGFCSARRGMEGMMREREETSVAEGVVRMRGVKPRVADRRPRPAKEAAIVGSSTRERRKKSEDDLRLCAQFEGSRWCTCARK